MVARCAAGRPPRCRHSSCTSSAATAQQRSAAAGLLRRRHVGARRGLRRAAADDGRHAPERRPNRPRRHRVRSHGCAARAPRPRDPGLHRRHERRDRLHGRRHPPRRGRDPRGFRASRAPPPTPAKAADRAGARADAQDPHARQRRSARAGSRAGRSRGREPACTRSARRGLRLLTARRPTGARHVRLTRRAKDLVVAIGIAWLAAALPAALLLTYEDLGWWLGHGFELVGLVLVGVPVAVDLFRTAQSRPLAGDLHAAELVAAEEAFLGAHVRALTIRLAQKDEYTEEHTRRVALRAVQVGERLGLPPGRLRALAIGGLMHDIGKLSVPDSVLKKPTSLTDEEFGVIQRHPEWGDRLVADLGGFTGAVRRLVRDHHERLDGSGYPRGLCSDELEVDTRILAVCDVYDALISARVYRDAWSHEDAIALLRKEAGTTLDSSCVDALDQVLAEERAPAPERQRERATSARRARTRPAAPAAETS